MKRIISILMIVILTMGLLVGCEEAKPSLTDTLYENNQKVASNQQNLEKNQPTPTINFSNERANQIKKATTFNDPNKLSYIYLFTKAGTIAGFYTVKGKVSNLSSYLVPDEQIIYSKGGTPLTLQSPDIDGSYGSNGEGIFFYTADNIYVEWNGEYMLVDQPLKVTTQPILIQPTK